MPPCSVGRLCVGVKLVSLRLRSACCRDRGTHCSPQMSGRLQPVEYILKLCLMRKAASVKAAGPLCPQSSGPVCHLQLFGCSPSWWSSSGRLHVLQGIATQRCTLRMLQGSEAQLRRAEAKLDAALHVALGDDPDDFDLADDFDAADSEDEGGPALRQGNWSGQGAAASGEDDPASFSRIDLSQPEAQIRAAFPQFPVRPLSPLACLLYH